MINAPFTHCAGCCNYYNGICNSIEKCPHQSEKSIENFPFGGKLYRKPFVIDKEIETMSFEMVFKLTKEAVLGYCGEFVGSAVWRAIVKHLDEKGIEVDDD